MGRYDLKELSRPLRTSHRNFRWIGMGGLVIAVVAVAGFSVQRTLQQSWSAANLLFVGLAALIGCGFGFFAFSNATRPPPETLEVNDVGVFFSFGSRIIQQSLWADSTFRLRLNYTEGVSADPVSKGLPAALCSIGIVVTGAIIPVTAYEEILREAQARGLRTERQGERKGWRQTLVSRE